MYTSYRFYAHLAPHREVLTACVGYSHTPWRRTELGPLNLHKRITGLPNVIRFGSRYMAVGNSDVGELDIFERNTLLD